MKTVIPSRSLLSPKSPMKWMKSLLKFPTVKQQKRNKKEKELSQAPFPKPTLIWLVQEIGCLTIPNSLLNNLNNLIP
jgi:hypothetical protein